MNGAKLWDGVAGMLLKEYGAFMLAGVVCGLPVTAWLRNRARIPDGVLRIAGGVCLAALTVVALSYVIVVDYNPFIYFNF